MTDIAMVDSMEILVIVDNVTDSLSTNPAGVEPELRGQFARGRIKVMSGAGILGVDFGAISEFVLSHGHWGHARGLEVAIEQIAKARGPGKVSCHLQPGMFAQRGMTLPSGIIFPMKPIPRPEELASTGATAINSSAPQIMGNRASFVSGEIPRVILHEKGLPGQVRNPHAVMG